MNVAVVGATGLVGRLVLELLRERSFPFDELRLFASRARKGVTFDGAVFDVEALETFRPSAGDLVLSCTPDEIARDHVPTWIEAGALVVDESAAFRRDPRAVLVAAGVNDRIVDASTNLIASPNCTTTQIALTLAPLHRAFEIEELVVSTYQSASGAGAAGLRALDTGDPGPFGRDLRGDLVPGIGREHDGVTSEEAKLVRELPRLLDTDFPVHATCVRVPVAVGHGASLHVRFRRPPDDAAALLESAFGVRVVDGAPGPSAVAGTDDVLAARIRRAGDHAIALWCLGDNLRVGSALNAVRLAETMLDVHPRPRATR